MDFHGHARLVENAAIPFGITTFPIDFNGQQRFLFPNAPHNLGALDYFSHPLSSPPLPQTYQNRQISLTGSCLYCRVKTTATVETPVWLCPTCSPHRTLGYCSRACLLSYAFEHSKVCHASTSLSFTLLKLLHRPVNKLAQKR